MSFEIVRSLSEGEWRHFVNENPAGNIFHTPEMFQVFSRVKGHHPEVWAAVEGDQVLALLVPVQITLMEGPLRYLTTRTVVYGGILSDQRTEGRQALARLIQRYKETTKRIPLFTEVRNRCDTGQLQPILAEFGFVLEGHLNYLIDLEQPEHVLWSNISKSMQKHIRTAEKKGAYVEEITDRKQVAVAYRFLREVFARVHVPLADLELFQAAFDILVPKGMCRMIMAHAGDREIGARIVLLHKNTILDWYAGASRVFSAYHPEELMIWKTITWGREHGFRSFDFGGAGKPDQDYGPRAFKSRWGGLLVDYGRNTFVHSPLRLRLSQVGYQAARRLL
jgi:serine/alanine adding enzyme